MNEPVNPAFREIIRLENMLTDAGIPHKIEASNDGWQIEYPDRWDRRVCSVIEFTGSTGAKHDRLEIMGLLNPEERKFDKVMGFLTAENVFDRIRRDWERRKKRGSKVEPAKKKV